jgi:hypothetical protein
VAGATRGKLASLEPKPARARVSRSDGLPFPFIEDLDRPTHKEVETRRLVRNLIALVVFVVGATVFVGNFLALFDWGGPAAVVGLGLVALPLLTFGPLLLPLHVRGHRVPRPE